MGNYSGTCLRCQQSLGLLERVSEDLSGISIPGKGEICPNCYRALSETERVSIFGN